MKYPRAVVRWRLVAVALTCMGLGACGTNLMTDGGLDGTAGPPQTDDVSGPESVDLAGDADQSQRAIVMESADGLHWQFTVSDPLTENLDELMFAWLFGDDTTAEGRTVEHTYAEPGTHILTVNAYNDADQLLYTLSDLVTAYDGTAVDYGTLEVAFDAVYTDLVSVWQIELTAHAGPLQPGETVGYEWQFGDFSTGDDATVVHETAFVGWYPIGITASTSDGRHAARSGSLWLPERRGPLFFLQSEHATVKDGGVIVDNQNASGGGAVLIPADTPPNLDNEQSYPIKVVFAFALEEPVGCRLYAGVFGASEQANSFFYRIDGDPVRLWEFPPADSFDEHEVAVVSLGKGMHTITFVHREPDVMLDYLRIESDPDSPPPSAPDPAELASFYLTTGVAGASAAPAPTVSGVSYLVSNETELDAAIAAAEPGDEIVFQDGDYTDCEIDFPDAFSGTADNKIVVRPASPRGVRFRGQSHVNLVGDHVHFEGFDFLGTSYLALKSRGNYNRITGNRFIACGERSFVGFVFRFSQSANYNEFDHNFFAYTEGICVGIDQPGADSTGPSPKHNYLHHNTFQDIERVHPNGGECIMAGVGQGPDDVVPGYDDETFTRIECNKFLRVNGDIEIVSIKSSRVTLRANAFIDSTDGHVSFRMAFDCVAGGNLLLRTAAGFRLTGSGHTLTNNLLFIPDSAEAFSLMNGSVADDGVTNYVAATDNLIAHNTVIGGESAIQFYQGAGNPTDPAANNLVTNNVFRLFDTAAGLTVGGSSTYTPLDGYGRNDIINNVIYASGGQLIIPDDGLNDLVDPLLDESGEVFPVLRPGSPCHNQAMPGLADQDFFGANRPANPDIGAIESP